MSIRIDESNMLLYVDSEQDLREAIKMDGYGIALEGDISLTEMISVKRNVIIDLKTYKVTASSKSAFWLYGPYNLVIEGGEGSGVVGTIGVGSLGADGGTLIIRGGLYKASSAVEPAVQTNGHCENITVICQGASFHSTDCTFYLAAGGLTTLERCIVDGATGVYIKSGRFVAKDTSIKAFGSYAEPVPNGNGASSTGDAVIIDSKEGYKGEVVVNIDKGCTLNSDNGFAFKETYTDGTNTAARSVTLGGVVGGKVSFSDLFFKSLESGVATVDVSNAIFTNIIGLDDRLLPEGAVFVEEHGFAHQIDEKILPYYQLFGSVEDCDEVASTVKGDTKVCVMGSKLTEQLKVLRSALAESYTRGEENLALKIVSKLTHILESVSGKEFRQDLTLDKEALYIYFALKKLIG